MLGLVHTQLQNYYNIFNISPLVHISNLLRKVISRGTALLNIMFMTAAQEENDGYTNIKKKIEFQILTSW